MKVMLQTVEIAPNGEMTNYSYNGKSPSEMQKHRITPTNDHSDDRK